MEATFAPKLTFYRFPENLMTAQKVEVKISFSDFGSPVSSASLSEWSLLLRTPGKQEIFWNYFHK